MKSTLPISLIQKQLSTLPEFSTCSVENVDEGVSTAVYRLLKGDEILYLRVSDEGENMSSEALAHKLVLEKGVKAPMVLYCCDFSHLLKRSFMITSEIKGTSLQSCGNIPEDVLVETGKQLGLINSIAVENFGWIDREVKGAKKLVGCYKSFEEFALNFERIENMLKDLIKFGLFDAALAANYMSYVIVRKDVLNVSQAVLSHGDFDLSHIYINRGVYSGIIDFGDIRATSVFHDLGHFYTHAPRYFLPLLSGFLSVNKLEDDYMEKIEFDATLSTLGKLWWISINIPNNATPKHRSFRLINCVLGGDNWLELNK